MRIKKFLLFTAAAAGERKTFVGSYDTREEAIEAAGRMNDGRRLWWQVIETATAECVAEDSGWNSPDDSGQGAPAP